MKKNRFTAALAAAVLMIAAIPVGAASQAEDSAAQETQMPAVQEAAQPAAAQEMQESQAAQEQETGAAAETETESVLTGETAETAESDAAADGSADAVQKTEEATPSYTVRVPAVIELGEEAAKVPYTRVCDGGLLQDGRKIAVRIADAGYNDVHNRFAVYSSDAADEQGYRLYDAASMSGSQAFGIGDEIACWESGTGGTILRSAALTGNYDDVRQGSYTGYINYIISLENTQN